VCLTGEGVCLISFITGESVSDLGEGCVRLVKGCVLLERGVSDWREVDLIRDRCV